MFRPRIFAVLALLLSLLPGAAAPLHAQSAAAPAQTAPAAAPVSIEELQHLVDTLQDDKERAKLVSQLQALIAAQRGEQKQEQETPAAWLNQFSAEIDAISAEIVATAGVLLDAPSIVSWIEAELSDAHARARWLDIGLKLGIVFGIAALGEWLLRLLLRRPQARLAGRSSDAPWAQALLLLLVLILEALPVFAFAGIAYFVLPLVQPRFASARVAEVIIQASLTARLILAAAHVALLCPATTAIYALSDETRNYLYIWARRFTNWAVYGLALASASWWLGVPGAIYALLLRGTMLVLGVLSVIFVLQNRAAVGDWLRGKKEGAAVPAHGGGHAWYVLRQRLADTWHVVAILYIVATFGSYVLRIEGGFAYVFRATLLSLVVLVAAGIIVRAVRRLSQRGFAIGEDLKRRFPGLEARANRYLPVLTAVASVIVYFFAVLALLQAWGFNAFAWFDTAAGHKITSALLSIVTVLVVALIIWELFGSAIERYLNGTNGHRTARSARARTLLPLLRTTVLIVLVTIVGLIILSEIGVNIAPLLAGAGVAGIAIGFGSQALVKDVITGLFILLEDTLAVGEVVDVGKDHRGIVEAISIRAIKLRDLAGTLHTVPFSEVSTVRNLTRDYSYFVADVGVLYREDPDRVIGVLQQVAEELRKDPDWSASIVEPLDVIGVDRFTDTAMVIRARLKTVPLRQWAVGREFNRRMKKAFDAAGIEMPAGNQTHYLDEVKKPG
jgi:small-conductance mechanosensitive channel